MSTRKTGTTIEGWKKQPKGHWYEAGTRSRIRLTDKDIEIVPGPGYAAVLVPAAVLQDVIASKASRRAAKKEATS